jgi:hypothetical protein
MSCLKESVSQAMKTLPTISTNTNLDGAERPEDPNLKEINHLANFCNIVFCVDESWIVLHSNNEFLVTFFYLQKSLEP